MFPKVLWEMKCKLLSSNVGVGVFSKRVGFFVDASVALQVLDLFDFFAIKMHMGKKKNVP